MKLILPWEAPNVIPYAIPGVYRIRMAPHNDVDRFLGIEDETLKRNKF